MGVVEYWWLCSFGGVVVVAVVATAFVREETL